MNCVCVAKIGFDRLISSEKRDDFAETDFRLNFSPSSDSLEKLVQKNSNIGTYISTGVMR